MGKKMKPTDQKIKNGQENVLVTKSPKPGNVRKGSGKGARR